MKCKLLSLLLLTLIGCSAGVISNGSSSDVAAPTAGFSQSSQATAQVMPDPAATMPEAITRTVSGVTVGVDPMIEMLSVIQYLSDYEEEFGLITKEKTSYQEDIEKAFRPFENHETILFYNDAMRQGFSFDIPPTACLYLDQNFAIRPEFEGSDYQRNRLGTGIDAFRDAMEQFYLDTNFGAFYTAHHDFYSRMVDAYAKGFPQWNMTDAMETYYGKEMAGYHINLTALFHPGGFGPSLKFDDGIHVYSIQGPYHAADDTPLFGDQDAIANLVIHEFGHSFVPVNEADNPAMVAEVQRSESLMEAIQEDMSRNAYNNWSSAYEELVLRAAVIDIMKSNTTVDLESLLQYERETGFLYIDTAYDVIQQYAQNREKYPVFNDFVPVITDALLKAYPDGAIVAEKGA